MDPVTVSVILATVGWLVSAVISKTVGESWERYMKHVGLNEKTKSLTAELRKVKLLVEAAESMQLPGENMKLLQDYLKEVKELIYKARDLLDELDYFRLQKEVEELNKAEHGNLLTRFISQSSSDVPSSSTAGNFQKLKLDKKSTSRKIKDLIKELKQAYESINPALQLQLSRSNVQGLPNLTNQITLVNRPQSTSQSNMTFYGRDAEINQILTSIEDVKQYAPKLSVITIVGNGGVGKTALAQQVYNHPTVNKQFNLIIWICVSTNFDEMDITKQMLEYCEPGKSYGMNKNLNNLKEILKGHLRNKKVLLVLDDIWEIKGEWNKVLTPLDLSTEGVNMVLVTTRDPSIAKMVTTTDGISGEIIHLDGLDETSFWFLFKTCVFGNDQHKVPAKLEEIGRKIAKNLKRYPLAAKTVGALLKGNKDVSYWMEILGSEKWKNQEGDKGIIPALMLSYEYLPVHLQRCFSYCSLFPKDYYFTAKELVNIWMTQDYIHTIDKRVEDVGIEYLQLLVDKAFFQVIVIGGPDVKYVIHDLMHDLAQVVSSEEIFAINHSQSVPKQPSLRHLSILRDVDTIENIKFHNFNSLVILDEEVLFSSDFKWNEINKVRLLILPFHCSILYNFQNFIHLRYLRLTGKLWHGHDKKAKWLIEICRLYHLQVLQLKDSLNSIWNGNNVQEIPKEFNNLVNLRHFVAPKNLHSKIVGVGKLKHLQELKQFIVREVKGFELLQLSELKELRGSLEIQSLQNVKSREEAERVKLPKKHITTLKLCWTQDKPCKNRGDSVKSKTWLNSEDKECRRITGASSEQILEALQPNSELRSFHIENYGGCKSPSWLTNNSIKYLESICLSNCEAWEELPNFGQLICLKKLYLSGLPRVKTFGPQFHGCSPLEGFPSLKVMHVSEMDGLETWDWGEECNVFPSLNELGVVACPKLIKFSLLDPIKVHRESTEWFPMLAKLEINDCPQLPLGRIRKNKTSDGSMQIELVKGPKVLDLISWTLKNIRSMGFYECSNLTSLLWKCICMIHGLKELRFDGCHELCFSQPVQEEKNDGSTSYSHESLQELEIVKCSVTGEEFSYLLAHLPALCKLSIISCNLIGPISLPSSMVEPNRSSLEADVEVDKDQQQSPDPLMCLEKLYIHDCPNMVFVNEGGLSGLTALKEVRISGSDNLLSSLNQKEGSNYVHTLSVEQSNVTSLKLYNFVALRMLVLWNCKDLASVEGPNSPASLEVHIQDCPQLAKTQNQVEPKFLMPMEKLKIDNIEFLSIHANSFSMSLHSLTIERFFTQLRDWSEWTEEQEIVVIKHLPALEELALSWCRELCSLPSTLHLHPSLKELTIYYCSEIKSLPERGFPKTLQKLLLRGCNEDLKSQCSQLKDFEYSTETYARFKYDVFSRNDLSVSGH